MLTNAINSHASISSHNRNSRGISLSTYFPAGTVYFYGYPSGAESGFLNKVPPDVEELVSARPLVCAGDHVRVVAFANPVKVESMEFIKRDLGAPLATKQQTIVLSPEIDMTIVGKRRDDLIKQNLRQVVEPGALMMAQPFLDSELDDLYQISPELSNWLNDKQNMLSFIPQDLVPRRYGIYENNKDFLADIDTLPVPCVVKVSASSSGDGVYICTSQKQLDELKTELADIEATILVEQYIDTIRNFGVQFGIPHDPEQPIDIIGVNRQLTTPEGEFIGGVIEPNRTFTDISDVKQRLVSEILPKVRELGWYGIGGFDVLVDTDGNCYIIDCNFRMTGMSAYLILAANRQIERSLVAFSGEFRGTLGEFQSVIKETIDFRDGFDPLRFIAVTYHEGVCRLNGALLFDDPDSVAGIARKLLGLGVTSKALDLLSSQAI